MSISVMRAAARDINRSRTSPQIARMSRGKNWTASIPWVAAFLAFLPSAQAQVAARTPRMGYVYPAGGRQGAAFRVTVGGQFLDGARSALVSGTGVRATVIEHVKPPTGQQLQNLREELKKLTDRKAAAGRGGKERAKKSAPKEAAKPGDAAEVAEVAVWTAEDEMRVADIREKLDAFTKRQANPALSEIVSLQVTVDPDAEPVERELRLVTSLGLTNPLVFHVGQLPEFVEEESKRPATPGGGRKPNIGKETRKEAAKAAIGITLPAIVNGQIMPGDVDRFRFTAPAGKRLVAAASARQLIPYLPDAVPGWFQATLAVRDSSGKELAYVDDYRFDPDPALCYEIPADGEYVVEIKDSIYRGREDFVYRIAVGELPFVTSIFPLGGPAGVPTPVDVTGWNIPGVQLTMGGEDRGPGILPLFVRSEGLVSNRVPFAVDKLPECLETEPKDPQDGVQQLTLPIIVNGRIGAPGDRDEFRFEGHAGSEIVAEVLARRLNSPLDSLLRLTDAGGRELAVSDDHEDKGAGLLTHHADSWLRATLPAEGTYLLQLVDAQQKGGAEYAYRLRVGPPRPDFELRVVPSSINARAGTAAPITVYALRRDGFSGDVTLELKDAPPGFALSGGRVPGGRDQVRLTLAVPVEPSPDPTSLCLEGRATIQDREVCRPAVPAEDMMQAFAYRHLVPAKELKVAVAGRAAARSLMKILGEVPVKIPAGGTTRVQIEVPNRRAFDKMEFELDDPPEGIAIQGVTPFRAGMEILLQSDASKVKPGMKGNLIVTVSARRAAAPDKAKAKAQGKAQAKVNPRVTPLATLPAIPFDIVMP